MNEAGKRITEKICEIYRSDNFTIAFLPYKRSMWNSMESVYEECVKQGIRAYICPMPYLRKSKDLNDILDKDKFEGGTDISHLPELNTDFIVIHYPYDGNNRVTSMIPQYYTAELRNYGKVIYIPYSCTNMRQLRVQPGIANVDYAFLNTPEETDAFVREWKEMGVDFSGRVFGLGSPKMDAIQKCGHGSATLIINSLGPFLCDPFGKIKRYEREIIDEIDKGHEVIFRPHPLLRQTIRSMRPDTESEYNEFIDWAESVGAEIDESEYLEDAISKADKLISDPSSVLEMWLTTGREYKII